MNAPRTSATEGAAKWDSSRTVTRGVSGSVEARRARALGVDKDKEKRRSSDPQPPKSGGSSSEGLSNFLGLLWIGLGAIVIVLCTVFVVGSVVMFGVLREISDARDYDDAAAQFADYEDFFKKVADAGFTVGSDKPNIKEGVTQYLWTVTPPNDGSMRVFSWQHDLQSNEVRPTSNAAALLDIELGRIDRAKAEELAAAGGRFQFDPNDAVANAIIDRNTSAFARSNGTGWGPQQSQIASAPPLPPPLFDPKSRTRKGVGAGPAEASEEETATDENPTDGGDGDQQAEPAQPPKETAPGDEDPQPPTEVEPAAPPEGDGGNDAGDGDDNGNGKQPKPKPEPGDGEGDGDGDATPVG
jgi:hypothetical protein